MEKLSELHPDELELMTIVRDIYAMPFRGRSYPHDVYGAYQAAVGKGRAKLSEKEFRRVADLMKDHLLFDVLDDNKGYKLNPKVNNKTPIPIFVKDLKTRAIKLEQDKEIRHSLLERNAVAQETMAKEYRDLKNKYGDFLEKLDEYQNNPPSYKKRNDNIKTVAAVISIPVSILALLFSIFFNPDSKNSPIQADDNEHSNIKAKPNEIEDSNEIVTPFVSPNPDPIPDSIQP